MEASKFPHSCHLWCPSVPSKSQPLAGWRSITPWGTRATQVPTNDQTGRARGSPGLAGAGGHGLTAHSSTRNSDHQPETWPGPVVQLAAQSILGWTHSSLGECCRRSLWKKETCSGGRTARLECQDLPSRSWVSGLRGKIDRKTDEGPGHQRSSPAARVAERSSQWLWPKRKDPCSSAGQAQRDARIHCWAY